MYFEHLFTTLLNGLSRRPKPLKGRRDGLFIGQARDGRGTSYPFRMPPRSRTEHAFLLGKTGTGKTHLLQQLALQHMEHREGFAFFDFHGDCSAALLEMATQYAWAADHLVLVDPTDSHASPGLNPLEMRPDDVADALHRVSELSAILRARWNVEALGPRTEELLRNTLYTLAANSLTLVEAPALLTSDTLRRQLTRSLPAADIQAYWRDRFEPLSEAMKASFREPLLNRITGFLVDPCTRHLLGQAHSTVDFQQAMQRAQWVIINLSKGVLRENAHTLANLVFAKLQFEIFGRTRLSPSERRLFTVLVDEVQNLAENDLITLFTEGRKFGVGLVTANQYWEQLPRSLRGALLAAGTQIIFRVSHSDASALAPELDPHRRAHYAELLTALPRGSAIVRVGASEPIRVIVPAPPAGWHPSPAAVASLRTLSVARYTRRRDEIEQDIQRRTKSTRHVESPHPSKDHASDEGQLDW